jgi:hypothetical protein
MRAPPQRRDVGLALSVTARHKQQQVQAHQRAAAKAAAQASARAAVQAAAAAQQATDQANQEKRVLRAGIVTALQRSITLDPDSRVKEGTLDGPAITSTSCTPLGVGVPTI